MLSYIEVYPGIWTGRYGVIFTIMPVWKFVPFTQGGGHSIRVLMNRDQMRQAVFEYIEVDYNRKREHRILERLSPEQLEKARYRLEECPF